MSIAAGYLVCGMPHILNPELNSGYDRLAKAMQEIGDDLKSKGFGRIIYYSTQWISVLGHSFQAGTNLQGVHVDENWHELSDLPFQFTVDAALAKRMATAAVDHGFQTKLIDYVGFPVDTGTIVADTLLNKKRFTVGMVSCCVYSDYEDTVKIASVLKSIIESDPVKTAVVCVSQLSGRYFTTDIDWREDHFGTVSDDEWNRKMLSCMTEGRYQDLKVLREQYVKNCKVDMGLKAMAFLEGMDLLKNPASLQAYEPVYGTGNAVVSFF